MTQWDAFLRAIVESPDDLTPRLIAADWLEETGDPAKAARAQFIRVQCELAELTTAQKMVGSCGGYYCDVSEDGCELHRDCKYDALRRRERDILREHGFTFLAGTFPQWKDCLRRDDTNNFHVVSDPFLPGQTDPDFYCSFRRGFVEAVSLTAAAFCGGVCEGCYDNDEPPSGAGHANFRRSDCPACRGTGRTAGCARELALSCPLCEVRLVGKEPAESHAVSYSTGESRHTHCWFLDDTGSPYDGSPARLPKCLFDLLPGEGEYCKEYATEADALTALPRACVRLASSLAFPEVDR